MSHLFGNLENRFSHDAAHMFQLQEREAAEQDLHRKLLFPNLSTLQIGFNQLDSLPEEIGELKLLKVLSLKKNSQLKEVTKAQ